MNKIVHTLFEERALLSPQKTAVEQQGRQITYASLNQFANQIAHTLIALDAQPQRVVGTFLTPSIGLVAAMLGIFKAGDIYLPLDPASSKRRLMQVFTQTACQTVITQTAQASVVQQLLAENQISIEYLILLDNETVTVQQYKQGAYVDFPVQLINPTSNPDRAIDPKSGNYIFYTSGSTGEEKAILGRHESLSHFIQWEVQEFGIDDTWRVSQLSQITFDASLRDILVPLVSGATLCIPPVIVKSNIPRLIGWLEFARISLLHCVPSTFRLMGKELMSAEAKTPRFSALKHVLMAGETIYGKDIAQWRKAVGDHVELVNLYGTSETTLAKTSHRIGAVVDDPAQVIHVGKPIDGAFVAIINDKEICRIGEIGEIYIKTPYTTNGYYRNERLNQTVFVANPLTDDPQDILYKTGDLGRYLKDRSIEVLGRIDDQVKVNGIRVELKEVEQAILRHQGVSEATVIAHKTADNFTELIGYFVGQEVSAEQLRTHLKAELNDSIIPSYLIALSQFPLSINGKIDKKALPKPESLVVKESDYEAPQTSVERQLEEIWKQVLGLKQVGRKLSFFEVGGNSLKGIQMISKIYKEFGVLVKINELFTHQSIKELGALISKATAQTYKAIPKVKPATYYELSSAQKRLWIIDQFEQDKAAYNVPEAVEMKGALNKDAFIKALETVVARHESLRTTFCTIDGQPRQCIHDYESIGFRVAYHDLRNTAVAHEVVAKLKAMEANYVFNLEKGPLIRATLLQLEDERYIFLITTHHIISDDHSLEVITQEVLALYDAFVQGGESPLAPLAIQYKDYAAWHNEQMKSQPMQEAKHYWLEQFSGDVPVLRLETDYVRPAIKTFAGDRIWFVTDPTMSQGLKNLNKQYGSTMFITLLALINALLYKQTGQEDLVVGTPVTGRDHPDLDDQIGFYVNTLALRNKLAGNSTFEDLLHTVKKNTLNAFEHKAYPFDTLVDDLDLTRDRSRNPLFDVGFTFMEILGASDKANSAFSKIEMDSQYDIYQFIKGDLWFRINDVGDNFKFIVCYNTDLFKPVYIEKLIVDLKFMMQQIIDEPRIELDTLVRRTAEHQSETSRTNQKTIRSRNLESLKNINV